MLSVWLRFTSILVFACLLSPVTGHAADPFYKGKRLTVLINFAAGGPTDIEGRLLARHLGRVLEGQPTMIVQNMDGAGGLIGSNYLGKVAPKDGTMVGYFTGTAWPAANQPERYDVDYKTYSFVAYQGGTSIYIARTDTAPGLKEATDIAKTQELVAGGLEAGESKDSLIRLSLDMLGVPYRYVTGYRSNANVRLALQKGEVNFLSESPPGYRVALEPDLVRRGEAIPIYFDPSWNGEKLGVAKTVADLPILPFQEVYRKIKGSMPSGQLWDAYLTILAINSAMQRILTLPPGAPAAAVAALQAAILKLNDDAGFAEDTMKTMGFVPDYTAGPDTARQIRQALVIRPDIRAFMTEYAKAGRH